MTSVKPELSSKSLAYLGRFEFKPPLKCISYCNKSLNIYNNTTKCTGNHSQIQNATGTSLVKVGFHGRALPSLKLYYDSFYLNNRNYFTSLSKKDPLQQFSIENQIEGLQRR